MAFVELTALRKRRNKTFQDDVNPRKRVFEGTLAAVHYESEQDSGVFDAEIDASPTRVDNAAFDGWRIENNGWHFALGKDLANHGDQDGWVGFGGRQGAHFFKFRLARLGYLHWPARAWDDIGGAPTYDRANLSQQTNALELGSSTMNVGSKATWANIWTTPGGGALDISWRVDGDRLKEEVKINAAARAWITTNAPPATNAKQTYFGFVFQVDWDDIPRAYLGQLLKNVDDEIDDDLDEISLRGAADELIGFLPWSYAYVDDGTPGGREQRTLRKRFWKDGDGNHYMMLGIRVDQYSTLPAGDIVFDPDVDVQIDADEDDAVISGSPCFAITTDNAFLMAGDWETNFRGSYMRFIDVTIEGTIVEAYLECYLYLQGSGEIFTALHAAAVDQPPAPESCEEWDTYIDEDLTDAVAYWDGAWDAGWNQSPDLSEVVQELLDVPFIFDADPIMFFHIDDGCDTSAYLGASDFVTSAANATKLHIEYSTGGPVTFAAVCAGVTTTPTAFELAVAREYAAVCAGVTATPTAFELVVAREYAATAGWTTTTPSAFELAIAREFAAAAGWVTSTPAIDLDALLVFAAVAGWVTTTPEVFELAVAREFAAVAGWATSTPEAFELAVLREFIATAGWQTSTPDDVVLDGLLKFAAVCGWQSSTPEAFELQLAREFAAVLAGQTTTPAVALNVARNFAAVSGWQTATPATDLAVLRIFAATAGWSTTTPAVNLDALLAFAAAIGWQTTTPDAFELQVAREFAAVLAGETTTPDDVVLNTFLLFAASCGWVTSTPEAFELLVAREFSAVLAGTTTTPDTPILGILFEFAAVLAGATTTPAVDLDRQPIFSAIAAGTTTTPTVDLDRLLAFSAVAGWQTSTPDTVELLRALAFAAIIAGVTSTPDAFELEVARAFAATMGGVTTTPSVELALELFFSAVAGWAAATPDDVELDLAAPFVGETAPAIVRILTGVAALHAALSEQLPGLSNVRHDAPEVEASVNEPLPELSFASGGTPDVEDAKTQ